MAETTFTLKRNAQTGLFEVTVDHVSDPDALPHEHTDDHNRIVRSLTNGASNLKVGRAPTVPIESTAVENQERETQKA